MNQQGMPLKNESIPKIVFLTKSTKEAIARELAPANIPTSIKIPTFIESIENVR